MKEKETDKGDDGATAVFSLCQAHSSVLYSNGTGNRLIIYPHNLSSGVAPKHSIITTSARAAVKHFSQQALKCSICPSEMHTPRAQVHRYQSQAIRTEEKKPQLIKPSRSTS